MPLAVVARNILDSFRFQMELEEDRGPRLAYACLYWGRYLYAKRIKAVGGYFEAHRDALEFLARGGWTQKPVNVRLPNRLRLKLDHLTCHILLKEIFIDSIYDADGSHDFAPRPNEVVFDIGAQQGVYSTLSALRVGIGGRVLSVEPDPVNFKMLSTNIEANDLHHVGLVQMAASDRMGSARFYRSRSNTGGHSLIQPAEGFEASVEVGLTTVDVLSKEWNLSPNLLKIDVEGSALAVVRGSMETIKRHRPRIVLEADSPQDKELLWEMLGPVGYRVSSRGNNLFAWPPAPDRMKNLGSPGAGREI